mmetsp:Transcript_10024/g.16848  ORF Transcript_10024/g.16848 Transcript_10024/m.16848 type:complete len:240 (-) Transcript_10024:588-1307(-)
MGGVGEHLNGQLLPVIVDPLEAGAEMVLDITSAHLEAIVGVHVAHRYLSLELSENGLHRLPDHVGQHVQPSSVGHSNNDLLGSIFNQGVHGALEAGDEALHAFETEPLHGVELDSDELGELVCPIKAIEDLELLLLGVGLVLGQLELVPNEIAALAVDDVLVLQAYLLTVSVLKGLNQVSEHPVLLVGEDTAELVDVDVEFAVQVRLNEAVKFVAQDFLELVGGLLELVVHRRVRVHLI